MKKLKIVLLMLLTVFGVYDISAQEKPKSPAEKATGTINGANIEINYCSPSVRGRKIWGELVPFGKVWRAGANDATTIKTDKELTIGTDKLPAGTYSFFVIPTEKECTIIFNKVAKQWGAYKYDQSQDQLRVLVKPTITTASVEKLVYNITPSDIILSWDNWNIGINVK